MPKAKKKTSVAPEPQISERQVATLVADVLEVYKTKCKSEILQFQNLERDNVLEISKVLDQQETLVKNQAWDQVNLLFKS